MALTTAAQRLQWARKNHGSYGTATEAARAFGWPVSTYLGHENGDRNPSRPTAKKYANAYKVRWEWLLDNEGPPTASAERNIKTVPLLSWVSAGRLADAQSQIPVEEVPLLAFADLGRGEFFALKVEGDSMDRLSPEGSVIVVNRAEREPITGKPYVFFHRTEGTTYKLWHANPDYLAPHSWNGTHQPIFIQRKKDLEIVGRVRKTMLDL
jgi:SOS-response transcriptional repressor LexA